LPTPRRGARRALLALLAPGGYDPPPGRRMLMKTSSTIHYSQLPPAEPGSPNDVEWETYRREVGRLLAEGREGQVVLIKKDRIVGFFNTLDDAYAAGLAQFLLDGFFIQEVREYEPIHYYTFFMRPWRISNSPDSQRAGSSL
jgi:hypothetical protein